MNSLVFFFPPARMSMVVSTTKMKAPESLSRLWTTWETVPLCPPPSILPVNLSSKPYSAAFCSYSRFRYNQHSCFCRTHVSYPIRKFCSSCVRAGLSFITGSKSMSSIFSPKIYHWIFLKYSMVLKWWNQVWKLYQDRLSIVFQWMLINSMGLLADNWTGYVAFFSL